MHRFGDKSTTVRSIEYLFASYTHGRATSGGFSGAQSFRAHARESVHPRVRLIRSDDCVRLRIVDVIRLF